MVVQVSEMNSPPADLSPASALGHRMQAVVWPMISGCGRCVLPSSLMATTALDLTCYAMQHTDHAVAGTSCEICI